MNLFTGNVVYSDATYYTLRWQNICSSHHPNLGEPRSYKPIYIVIGSTQMYLQYRTDEHQPITFGDLCEALADRELPAAVHDGYYVFRKRDLRRFVASASGEQTP